MSEERHNCTADDPWDKSKSERAQHLDAEEVSRGQRENYPGGDLVSYWCPHCKLKFTVELPQ